MSRAGRSSRPSVHQVGWRRPSAGAQTVPLTREGDSQCNAERSDGCFGGGSAPARATPLADHLRDAIRLNRARRNGYRQRGGLRAGLLSRLLVASERMLLLPARRFDRQVVRFDVPILAAELADMADAPPADRLLPDPAAGTSPVRLGWWPRRGLLQALVRADLAAAAAALAALLAEIRQAEQADGRHRALAAHVVESAGWMAERGAEYARQTDGATTALSVRLVRGHLALLPMARALDRLAAPVHRRGAGLFVNDLPPIPFPRHE